MHTKRRNAAWRVIRKRPDLRCALQPDNVELNLTFRIKSLIESLEMTFRKIGTLMSRFTFMLMLATNRLRSKFDISYILNSRLKGNRQQQIISERVFHFQLQVILFRQVYLGTYERGLFEQDQWV